MFRHVKQLQYTVRVAEPNPGLANLLLEQFGGPQGELAAACRYFTQGLSDDDPGRKDMLMDIATEELSHLEIIGTLVGMLNKGAKGALAEGVENEAELYRSMTENGNDSHITSLLYGGGTPLTNSAGVPWTAAYVDTIGEPTADLRSNVAAEARAKIIYERLINVTDDPGVKDALAFLMTREAAHQLSFEKALQSIRNNFPPGKLPPIEEFTNKYSICLKVERFAEAGTAINISITLSPPSLRWMAAMAVPASRSQPSRQPWLRRCLPARNPIHIPTR